MQKSITSFFKKDPNPKVENSSKEPKQSVPESIKKEPEVKTAKTNSATKANKKEEKRNKNAEIKKKGPLKDEKESKLSDSKDTSDTSYDNSPIKIKKRSIKKCVIDSDEEYEESVEQKSSSDVDKDEKTEVLVSPKMKSGEDPYNKLLSPMKTPDAKKQPADENDISVTPEKTPGGFYKRKTAELPAHTLSSRKRKSGVLSPEEPENFKKKLKAGGQLDGTNDTPSSKNSSQKKSKTTKNGSKSKQKKSAIRTEEREEEKMETEDTENVIDIKEEVKEESPKEDKNKCKTKRKLLKEEKSPVEDNDKSVSATSEASSVETKKEKTDVPIHSFFAPKSASKTKSADTPTAKSPAQNKSEGMEKSNSKRGVNKAPQNLIELNHAGAKPLEKLRTGLALLKC